jgi:hypothetical protein
VAAMNYWILEDATPTRHYVTLSYDPFRMCQSYVKLLIFPI